jgi:hypothetical protein
MFVKRRIYFYSIRSLDPERAVSELNPRDVAEDIRSLRDADRYLSCDGFDLCVIPEAQEGRFRFGRKRDSALLEKEGTLLPLMFEQGEGLFDCIHVAFLPDGIVAADVNLHGPRLPQLSDYLARKLPRCVPVAFDILLRSDVASALAKVKEIRLLQMRIDPSNAEIFAPLDAGFPRLARAWQKRMGAGSLEITLKYENFSRHPLSAAASDAVRAIVAGSDYRLASDKFRIRVSPDGQRTTMLDLLEDKFSFQVSLPDWILRYPDTLAEKIYLSMERWHQLSRAELRQAARISECADSVNGTITTS